jgi:hypothetical protein
LANQVKLNERKLKGAAKSRQGRQKEWKANGVLGNFGDSESPRTSTSPGGGAAHCQVSPLVSANGIADSSNAWHAALFLLSFTVNNLNINREIVPYSHPNVLTDALHNTILTNHKAILNFA